ncbi:MAG: 30S ribosomal protein S14 [Candidatus Marinimicrobia bacterium]|nr:30S ribosomal protein S14 [Candidatus Neomarinimicrobiota bacterium]|tara:strand:- start:514 stop:819 length:306 start_codon:yes stop_codon:yes gene_type:complete
MAKKSKIMHNIHRKTLVERYAAKRKDLIKKINDTSLSFEERQAFRLKLEKLPKNSNPNRVRNRCNLTGRPRSYYRRFGLSRISLREMASNGLIPGVTKASW